MLSTNALPASLPFKTFLVRTSWKHHIVCGWFLINKYKYKKRLNKNKKCAWFPPEDRVLVVRAQHPLSDQQSLQKIIKVLNNHDYCDCDPAKVNYVADDHGKLCLTL